MRKVMSAAVVALCTMVAVLALSASAASGQAAAPNCPPGQPSGRPAGTPPGNPPANTGRPEYPPGRCQLALSRSAGARGDTFTATGGGFVPGEEVTLSIAGSPVRTALADTNGAFAVELTVPQSAPIGRTEVLADSASQRLSAAFEVVAAGTTRGDSRAGSLLPRTGAEFAATASLGVVLVGLGAVLVIGSRRRRPVTA